MGPVGCGGPGNAFIPVEELLELEQQPLSAHILGDAKGIVMGKCRFRKGPGSGVGTDHDCE